MTDPKNPQAINLLGGDLPADWNQIADRVWKGVIARVETSPLQIALVVTGGGSGSLARCFGRAGASRHFVDAAVPYSRRSLSAYLGGGGVPQSVCRSVAESMARAARQRAADWGRDEVSGVGEVPEVKEVPMDTGVSMDRGASVGRGASEPTIAVPAGIALTAALPTSVPPDRMSGADPAKDVAGLSHCWISAATGARAESWHYRLPPGMDRETAELAAQTLIAVAIAWVVDPSFASQIRSKFPFQPE